MTKALPKVTFICAYCKVPLTNNHPNRRYCSIKCRNKARLLRHHPPLPEQACPVCGKVFKPQRIDSICCSKKCYNERRWDVEKFKGLRTTAIGYGTRTCWICHKTNVKKMHIHHVFGRHNADEPLVALCAGCHELVSKIGHRRFLDEDHTVADLITLARFDAGLPDARTIVKYEYTEKE